MSDEPDPQQWASSEDVLSLWVGKNKPSDTEQVDAFCAIAQAVIVGEFPDIQTRIATSDDLALRAKFVVVQLVSGLYKNPDNLKYFQESTGPWLKAGNVSDQLLQQMTLTDDQRKQLAAPKRRRGGMTDLDPSPDLIIGDPYYGERFYGTLELP